MKNRRLMFLHAGMFLLLAFLTSCRTSLPPTTVAISKSSDNYVNWLRRADSTVKYVNLYALTPDSAVSLLEQCDGLLLTGGEDVFPGIYGQESDTIRCGTIDYYRDTLEINLILHALDLQMPIFGVCRGEQLLNVVFGGELMRDIPQDFPSDILHRCEDYRTCFHMVYVEPGSFLHDLCLCDSALVTTNHHQAVSLIAPDLTANSYGPDRLIEGIELANRSGQPFFLGVQWHPERMSPDNPLSGPLADAFLNRCRVYSLRW